MEKEKPLQQKQPFARPWVIGFMEGAEVQTYKY